MRRTELAVDAEPRADVVVLDTIGELAHLFQVATVVFVGGSLVGSGRPQHPRAGRARQADRLRPAHAELRGDCGDVPDKPGRHPGDERVGADRRSSCGWRAIRSSARGSARRRARWSRPTAAPSRARSRRSPICSRRPAAAASCGRSGVSRGSRSVFHRPWTSTAVGHASSRADRCRSRVSVGNLAMGGRGKTPRRRSSGAAARSTPASGRRS